MRRVAICLAGIVGLGACSRVEQAAVVAPMQDCATMPLTGELVPGVCRIEAAGQALRVTYAPVAAGGDAGVVNVEVLDDRGAVVQTLVESGVAEYLAPRVQDIDGDGRADVLIGRARGNVNTESGVWLFSGARSAYQRVGEVSGVDITRTEEGYIAVPARSGAASWSVAFYRLDEGGLSPLATIGVDARDEAGNGRVVRSVCRLVESPGLDSLNLTASEAEARFCAEPAAGVFGP